MRRGQRSGGLEGLSYLSTLLEGKGADELVEAIKRPPTKYFIRVNTLLAQPEEVVEEFKEAGLKVGLYGSSIPEAMYLEVEEQELREEEAAGLKEVIVDRFTAESAMMGADVYAPGVKKAAKIAEGELVAVRSEDGFLVAVGVVAARPVETLRARRGLLVRTLKAKFNLPSIRATRAYQEGLIYPQSLPSMAAVRALDPKPGWRLVDLTAAPGGKVSYAYQLMGGEGLIIAVDRSNRKVEELRESLARMKMLGVQVLRRDSRYLDLELPNDYFDAAMVDPPCSALGVRPKLRLKLDLGAVKSLSEYQRQFLRGAAKLIKRGGRILYSTCTLTKEENEDIVDYAERELGLAVAEPSQLHGSPSLLEGGRGPLARRFYPHIHDTPGFFYAVLERRR